MHQAEGLGLSTKIESLREGVWLTDSFPVALAKQGHRFGACVAKELANTGYLSIWDSVMGAVIRPHT